MSTRSADLNALKKILDGQANYKKARAKRKHIESLIPKNGICPRCNQFAGCMVKDWKIQKWGINQINSIMCSQCDSEIKINQDWLQLNKTQRIELVFTIIFQHELMFRKLCRFDEEIFDNAVLDRIENFIDNYDPSRGILYSYLKNAVGWYAYKAANVRARNGSREIKESDIVNEEISSSVCQSYVNDKIPIWELLESLHPFDAWLIENHIINGYSQEELAKKAKRSKATINVWIAKVCDKLRREYVSG